ncbi:MAG: hypothetical protein WDA27_00130 [Actinomycetota bacterium]
MKISRMFRESEKEDGVAMIIAVVLSAVIATLAVTSLTVAVHVDNSAARGRHWVQALHVAESGVEQTIAKIQAASGAFSGTFSGETEEGNYSVTVTRSPRNVYTIDSVGHVREGRDLSATRALRVTLAPPAAFKNALFSQTIAATKNGDTINGDIWANQSVIVEANAIVHGSVTGATGWVALRNGSLVDGDASAGGYDPASSYAVTLGTNARIGGDVVAAVVNPPDPITCGGANPSNYRVQMDSGARIDGGVTTWGSVTGSGTVGGTISANICTAAQATVPMPTFTYAAANYDAATLHQFGLPGTPSETAVADFQTHLAGQGNQLSGTFYVNQAGSVNQGTRIDLTGATIVGDATIVTNTPVFTNSTTDNVSDGVVLLASTYRPPTGSSCDVNQDASECAIHLKNNFQTSGNTAVLVYAPYGAVAVKNNAIQFGAIYADAIEIKNNQSLTYDARIERTVGFGPVTLEIVKWLEI